MVGHARSMSGGRIERGIRRRVFGRTPTSVADQQPPPCPAGWRTGPPDFVGVGVQRGGTSWWFRELSRHRDVHQAPGARKELHFFDPFSNRSLTAADIRRYHQWFARPDGGITGEWSPVYVYEPWAVPMLALAAPDARYLLLLRDPIDRFRSGVEFAVRKGFSHSAAVLDAFHRGLYAEQVARLLDHVPRERLLVLLYEELRARGPQNCGGARRSSSDSIPMGSTALSVRGSRPRVPIRTEALPPDSSTRSVHGIGTIRSRWAVWFRISISDVGRRRRRADPIGRHRRRLDERGVTALRAREPVGGFHACRSPSTSSPRTGAMPSATSARATKRHTRA